MMDESRKTLSFILILLISFMFFLIIGQYLLINRINVAIPIETFLYRIRPLILVRAIYALLIVLEAYLFPLKTVKYVKDNFVLFALLMFGTGAIVVIGWIHLPLYNLVVFPIAMFAYTFIAMVFISSISKGYLVDEDSIFGVSKEKSDFYFEFETKKGTLSIHKPQQNFWLDGGPGSGKSDTFLKGMINQCAKRNYAGFIYDWEGDPMVKNSPLLTKVAYASIKHHKEKGDCKLNFAFINFTDMLCTNRVNIFSENYVPDNNPALFISNITTSLMKNLNPEWKEKIDFWGNNAIMYVTSVALKCYREREKGIGTLAHVVAICLSSPDAVFNWLAEDEEIYLMMSSMINAHKLGAAQQTAGAVSSAQTPLTKLLNKNIFWVMSAPKEEELSLDITNKDNPTLLCVGNSDGNKAAVSPAISCITSVLMSQMNRPDKQKSVFLVDEFPTIAMQGIDVFIGTARKHYVSTILALQDFNQAIRDYGEKSANILKASCGTQAFGMTGNVKTAEEIEKLCGEIKMVQDSYSTQDTGGGSKSESLQKEKAIKARDVAGQKVGHFVGKIANGEPPFFNTQLKIPEYYEEKVPLFSSRIKTGDEKLDREIMDEIVTKNYNKILDDVSKFLAPYREALEN